MTTSRPARLLRYVFAGLLALIFVIATWAGMQWYWSLIGGCTVCVLVLGRRRMFRPGVTRTTDAVVCSYVPWFEGNVYVLNIVLPLMALAMIAAGYEPGNPAWFPFGGVILLLLTPLFTSSAYRMWRRSFLRITSSELRTRSAAPKDELAVIPRGAVETIAPKIVPNGVGGEWLQVEICYRTGDLSSDPAKTILLGLQLTVEPANLCRALMAWQEAAADDPDELMARIERILRGHATADV